MSANPLARYLAEFIGTCLLVLMGCGCAVIAGGDVGFIGVSFAFGTSLLFLAYCLGPISGCHLNPAVTLCLAFSKKFQPTHIVGYIIAQCLGAILGGFVIYLIASGKAGFDIQQGFALNGFGVHSPQGYNMLSCLITEAVMTAVLLFVILLATHKNFPPQFTGVTVGFTLAAIHLVSIPVTNTSVNIARSLGVAVFHRGWAIEQLWLFAVAHIIAVVLATVVYKCSCCQD